MAVANPRISEAREGLFGGLNLSRQRTFGGTPLPSFHRPGGLFGGRLPGLQNTENVKKPKVTAPATPKKPKLPSNFRSTAGTRKPSPRPRTKNLAIPSVLG